ncbi:MAG: GlsB/YeaQ/YmgE family stress response membrane protein [Acidimicrobiia bacterium]
MGDVLSTIVGGLIAGIIIGPLARLVLPGKQNISVGMTILIGAIGAIVGGFIAVWAGVDETEGIDWIKHAIQVGVAVVVVLIYGAMAGRRGTSATA